MVELVRVKTVIKPDLNIQVVIELAADPNKFQDIHSYDGKYKHSFEYKYSREEKIKKFELMKIQMQELKINLENIKGLDLVINDLDSNSNFDQINNLHADDLLAKIYDLLQNYDDSCKYSMYNLLIDEMDEMIRLGSCCQGRCSRLYQVYITL